MTGEDAATDGMETGRLAHFDMIRGLAALVVMIGHLRAMMFVFYEPNRPAAFVEKAFYMATGYGHEAVLAFFVLSGFFISRSIVQALRAGRWSWMIYLIHRLSRLWLVLIPALLVTWGIDRLGYAWSMPGGLYPDFVGQKLFQFNGVTFLGNLFFLQTIAVPSFGMNSPLWTLANEFWYYMIFPLFACAIFPHSARALRSLAAVGGVFLLVALPFQMVLYFGIWLMGYGVYEAGRHVALRRIAKKAWFMVFSILLLAAVLWISRTRMAPKLLADYAVGFGVSLLLSALNASPGQPPVAYRQTAGFLSAISYSLYAFHFPLCVFLVSLLLRSVRLPFLGYTFGLYAVVAGGIVLIATLLHAAFEARTEQVRRVVLDRLVVAQTRFTRPRKME